MSIDDEMDIVCRTDYLVLSTAYCFVSTVTVTIQQLPQRLFMGVN